MFRPTIVSLTIALLAGFSSAQTDAQSILRAKLEKKLESPFIAFGSWVTDYDAARATAAKTGKLVFGYFSRSYAP